MRLPAVTSDPSSGQTLSVPPFFTTSFDCTKAKILSSEEAICKNEELAKLDVEMATVYGRRLRSTSSEKNELVRSQQKWLTIRNSYNANPYHGDPAGVRSDLADFYRSRIAALRSAQAALLDTKIPQEYEWLKATAPAGFSKGFSLGRAYMSCEDPCKKKPSPYRWISIWGRGIGEEPGDIDTPFAKLAKKLASEGWNECRSADDSGKPTMNYFVKGGKMVGVSRYYSMGAGNSIGFGITISGPLPQSPPEPLPRLAVAVDSDWITYSSPDVGLLLRYPPDWDVRDESASGAYAKNLLFAADDFKPGDFRITMEPEERVRRRPVDTQSGEPAPRCALSRYRISGFPAQTCLFEGEIVGDGKCNRYIQFVEVDTGKYDLRFEPAGWGSFVDDSNGYRLTDLYEKILSTIEIKQRN